MAILDLPIAEDVNAKLEPMSERQALDILIAASADWNIGNRTLRELCGSDRNHSEMLIQVATAREVAAGITCKAPEVPVKEPEHTYEAQF